MCWYEIDIVPRDVLFFRDAKPMAASSVGEGARWPWPNTLHDSLMSAFHDRWPERQEWEFEHKNRNDKDRNWDTSSMRFGGLKSVGVFPARAGDFCLPKPADISKDGTDCARLEAIEGESNLPSFLEYTVLNARKEGKDSAGEWISAREMERYIKGDGKLDLIKSSDLFDAESRFGIAIDPETGTADKGKESDDGGKLYIAEYLRLRADAGIKGFASCTSSVRGEEKADVMQKFFAESKRDNLVFGGQRGLVEVSATRTDNPIPFQDIDCSNASIIKWILLTPAIFSQGWRPGWVDSGGQVCLTAERPDRKPKESRAEWRERFGGSINAKLVAARIDKPLPISGWSLAKGGPRAMRLAVPSGSVYYFKAATESDANALIKTLQGHCKSDYYGEKGFGFGICAPFVDNN